MPRSAKGTLGIGLLVAAAITAACTIEVNINSDNGSEAGVPSPLEAPRASEIEAPPTPSVPPAASPAPVPLTPPPVAEPREEAVRDALFRFRQEAEQAPNPERERPPDPDPSRGPTFTPFTEAPSILNRSEIIEAMRERYPPLLREAGIGGTARVYFYIGADGTVEDVRLDASSGHPALDEAALDVAGIYRFAPALNRDRPVPVWVSFPITFQVR